MLALSNYRRKLFDLQTFQNQAHIISVTGIIIYFLGTYYLYTVQKLPKTSPSWPNISPKLIFMTPNVPTWPQIAQIHFPWVYYMILCHVGPPWGLFRGPLGPRWPLKSPQGGPIWHIIKYYVPEKCLRAIWSHAGTFWVMKGYFGSWSFFIERPFWVMNDHFGL